MRLYIPRILRMVALVGLTAASLEAQPTELDYCVERNGPPTCQDIDGASIVIPPFSCPSNFGIWKGFNGRVAFGPFLYLGPIQVQVDALRSVVTDAPLYVEYVPLNTHPPSTSYCDGPGLTFFRVYGREFCELPGWESRGPRPLNFMQVGDQFALRLHFLAGPDGFSGSPFVRCIRMTSHPLPGTTSVEATTWSATKELYR